MVQLSENNLIDTSQLIENFRSRVDAMANPASADRYRKAVSLFAGFLGLSPDQSVVIDHRLLTDWILHLWLSGAAYKTSLLYFDIVAGLYNALAKEKILPATDAFGIVRDRLKDIDESLWTKGITPATFNRALTLVKAPCHAKTIPASAVHIDQLPLDLLTLSLISGCLPLAEVASLKLVGGG